ncbi:MAG TPA: phage tail protein, partial [Stellaceae bacterium]|nr:phage tail protein [Stellaceae bacterium]
RVAGGSSGGSAAAVALGLCEGPIAGIGAVWTSQSETSMAALGLSLFAGAYAQAPWGYLSSLHPNEALGYSGTAYAAGAGYQLDGNAQLPNHNFEVEGFFASTAPGMPDADPSRVVADLLTSPYYGAGFPPARLGSLATYRSYTLAAGLWISPAYSEQTQASSMLDDIATYTNSEFVWSSGVLSLVPRGDAALSANGYSYTPPSAPLYDLGDDDFLPNTATGASASSDDPVLVTRIRAADALNDIKLEYLDRSNNYNTSIVEASDQAMIDIYGLRSDQGKTAHLFCDVNAARQSAQLLLQRQAIRNTYQFTLDQRYILLDPMDIVTLTDARLGLARQWVRITEITENDDGTLLFAAEDYLAGTGSAATYSFASGSGYSADLNSDPGDALAPIVFEPPVQIAASALEVWLATAGGPLWGGADIYVSSDGSTYRLAATTNGPARMGALTASLAAGGDPDTADTIAVDLSSSRGSLLSGTQSDADLGHTLCYVADSGGGYELVSYETATLTGSYAYALGTYLRRGLYGTGIAGHASGAAFARLDDAIVKLAYDKSQIGATIYLKLVSFNLWGGGAQQLADVPAYAHVIAGPPAPPDVTGFAAQQAGAVVAFAWDTVSDAALKGYDIGYAPEGTSDWSLFALLTEAAAGTEMTNAEVPPGSWTFAIRARDIADRLSPNLATVDLIVTNPNAVIYGTDEAPLWPGTLSGFVRHYTGVLTPAGSKTVDHYAAIAAPAAPSLSASAGGALGAATLYAKITYVDRTGETLPSSEASLAVSAGKLLSVASPSAPPASATGWNVYVGTTSGGETRQNASPLALGAAWTEPASGLVGGAAPPGANTTGWDVFDFFVPDPVSSARYATGAIDTGYNDTLRVFATESFGQPPSPLFVAGPPKASPALSVEIDTWLSGAGDPGTFAPWGIGYVSLRYLRAALVYDGIADDNIAYIGDFTPTIDTAPAVETSSGVTIAAGGTTVTFPAQFHAAPQVVATCISNAALTVTATGVNATGCTFHVWNSSGSDVGGVINYTATGE